VSAQIASIAALGVVLAIAFGWYEKRRPPARTVALVAAMAALAVVGRLAFAAVPGVKPTTDIVLFAGYALGGLPGFMVGAVTAVASNVFFGQGPWTIWQMVAWGAVGVGGAALARLQRGREPSRWVLAGACAVAAAAFGGFMDMFQWSTAAEQTTGTYGVIAGTSLAYNATHVAASVTFAVLVGPTFVRAIQRYRRRFEVEWETPPERRPLPTPVR
jgi:energy-coupling factor transport system substrate-specific component